MKRLISIILLIAVISGCSDKIFAPDRLLVKDNTVYVADRGGLELLAVDMVSGSQKAAVSFDGPVTGLEYSGSALWAVTEGVKGALYKLDPSSLDILGKLPLDSYLSAVKADGNGNLWLTKRYEGKAVKVDANSMEAIFTADAGREPCDIVVTDSLVYILGNLPAQSAIDYPIASAIVVLDGATGERRGEILLPNGTTDAFAMVLSNDGRYIYVTHLLARYQLPTSQITRGWIYTNAMSLIDVQTGELYSTVLLDGTDRGAANPGAVKVSGDGRIYVAIRGTDEVVEIDQAGMLARLDSLENGFRGVENNDPGDVVSTLHGLRTFHKASGKGVRGMDLYRDRPVVTSYYTAGVKGLDDSFVFEKGVPMTSTKEGRGDMYFHDGLLSYQGWLSCASCHPNDARSDGLNWDLLNDGITNPKNAKSLLYSHQTPPVMISGIRKDAYTAVRTGFKHISFIALDDELASDVDAYLISLEAVPSPYLNDPAHMESAGRGKAIFDSECMGCHSGQYYTNMAQIESPWNKDRQVAKFDVSGLRELWRTAPYLYDGRAADLNHDDVFHFTKKQFTAAERQELIDYLLTL